MVGKADMLAQLERLARIKAERELKRFAAFSLHMKQAQGQADAMRTALDQSYRSQAPLSVAEARIASAQAGRSARDLHQAEQNLARMLPRFEAARLDAAREFGRAEVLLSLSAQSRAKSNSERY
ncbi:hypothetical protein EYE42_04525 [Paracoccus subflavus]|uniref:Uncharacterized protein n=1 Tax=Paracoccus subflavus TaxID=2528244 RepID=A0A4V2JCN2_9RHOB|nr:hypothetical protein [Paracoccus subflavus]TBN42688.1 hypothetical protein EYE42_04525 [Paracoccus subflavus]